METSTIGIAAEDTSTPVTMPPKIDRFLIGIVVAIVVLLVVAGISIVLLRQPAGELPAGTPGGTVPRFYTALEQQD